MAKKSQKQSLTIEQQIIELYESGKSLREVGEIVKKHPNSVMKIVKAAGKLRDKSIAQKKALESGKTKHPTAGTTRSEETRKKISESVAESWQNTPEEKKKEHAERSKKTMAKMTPQQRAAMQEAAAKGLERARKEGSKLEHFVRDSLIDLGYVVDFHRIQLLQAEKLEIDIFLPKLGIAIEIDGPFHHRDDWGPERYEASLRQDKKKNDLLLSHGFSILRVKYDRNNVSQKFQNDVLTAIITEVEKIRKVKKPQLVKIEV